MNVDDLRQVRTVVTHRYADHACPDGVASAIILNDVYENTDIVFVAHGTPEYRALAAKPGMLFVDIVPPEDRLQDFIDAGAIVLDHHEKQRDLVTAFGARGVYADEPGVSGAMLAFREVWLAAGKDPGSAAATNALELARLAGIRDTWQTMHTDWTIASAWAAAMSFYPWRYFKNLVNVFGGSGWADLVKMMQTGRVLLDKRDEKVLRLIEQGCGRTVFHGVHVMIIPSVETSDVAEALGDEVENAPDIVCGFAYQGGEAIALQLSMRSRRGYDVGALCKALGGGGHRAAAGVTIPVPKGGLNPYETIWQIVDDYEQGVVRT